jgi:hypothetical protein
VADYVAVPESLRWTPVINEPLVVLIPKGKGERSLEDLIRKVPYICYSTQVQLSRQIDTEIARLSSTPLQVVQRATSSREEVLAALITALEHHGQALSEETWLKPGRMTK